MPVPLLQLDTPMGEQIYRALDAKQRFHQLVYLPEGIIESE